MNTKAIAIPCFFLKSQVIITLFAILAAMRVIAAPSSTQLTNNFPSDEIVVQIELIDSNQLHGNITKLFQELSVRRQAVIKKMLYILNSPQTSMSAKSCAAHYLGELHAEEAVDGLSAQIGVLLTPFGHGPFVNGDEAPAANALIKIGTSSIPAVIRILSETDDGLTRFTCLQVLASIDRDNDVTQLRLEKALKAEKDGKKQSRFQAALKLRAEHLKATGQ